jgi:hypothetical protein
MLAAASAAAFPVAAQASGARAVQVADSSVRWQALSPDQREILAPLRGEWPRMDAESRQKWLTIAGRYRSLSPAERERISSRMQEWVGLSPQDRGSARLSFEEAKQVPKSERQARWEKYLALPPEEKQRFEAEAAARRQAALRAARAGRSDPAPVATADGLRPKVNATPARPAPGAVPLPVAPTTVRAGQGATTRPIGQTPAPPAHQQAGMPKIATTPEFVNDATLLPRRGPQAAAVTPPPATAGQATLPTAAARKGAAPSSAPQ